MHLKVVEHQPASPSKTRAFLLNVNGVLDADVWSVNHKMLARVTVNDWSLLSDTDLRMACQKKLGAEQTPALIMIERIIGERESRAA